MKIVLSGSLLIGLLAALDWQAVIAALGNVGWIALLIAFVILLLQFVISAWKWKIALVIHGLAWRILPLIRIAAIGFFFNNFLPTAIGGDIYRAYRTMPGEAPRSRAVSAILLDRIVGLLALFVIAAIGSILIYSRNPDTATGLMILLFVTPLIGVATIPTLIRISFVKLMLRKLSRTPRLEPLVQNAQLIAAQRSRLAHLMFVSILFQVLAVAVIALLFASLRIFDIVAESAVIGAASAIASLLPISINGIGVMEGSFALTAGIFGVNFDSAIIVALLLRLSTVIFSLIGAVIFAFDRGRAADMAALAAPGKPVD